jgi:hypothetical protein
MRELSDLSLNMCCLESVADSSAQGALLNRYLVTKFHLSASQNVLYQARDTKHVAWGMYQIS